MTVPQWIHFVLSEAVRFVTPVGLAVEWIAVVVIVILVLTLPQRAARPLAWLRDGFEGLANRPRMAMLACLFLPVCARLLMLPIAPVPQPSIHDEFSHLLLADTLAHGRLTNPTPKMWSHLETIHVIQKPTYNSMYQPAHGITLAIGQVLFHEPWAGVELGVALMCGAMYWMFLGWLPKTWALFGILLAALKLALVGFWVNSYMGGSVPAIGGAMVVGAYPRLKSGELRTVHAVIFGVGAVILMNSRPFEGGMLTATVLALLFPTLRYHLKSNKKLAATHLLAPAAAILLAGVAFLAIYNHRVTGKYTRLPYQVNRTTYGWPENLATLRARKVTLRDPVLRNMYEVEIGHRSIYKSASALLDNLVTRLFDNWAYLVGPALTIPLLFGVFRHGRRARALLLLLLTMALLNLFQMLLYPYHLAPVVPVLFCLITLGCQRIFDFLKRLGQGRALLFAGLLPISLLGLTGIKQFGDELEIPTSSYWERGYEWHRDARAAVVDWLKVQPGQHLVIVRYAPNHPVNQEWVYNGADIDGGKILWAREQDEASNQELLKHYSKRHAWLLEADAYPQRVVPYPVTEEEEEPATPIRCPECTMTAKLKTAASS